MTSQLPHGMSSRGPADIRPETTHSVNFSETLSNLAKNSAHLQTLFDSYVQLGDVEQVIKLLEEDKTQCFYTPSNTEYIEIMRDLRDSLVQSDEDFIKGYRVLAINQWDVEQERIILITTRRVYHIKTNSAGVLVKATITHITDICRMVWGPVFSNRFEYDSNGNQTFAIRLFTEEGVDPENLTLKEKMNSDFCSFKTYKPKISNNETIESPTIHRKVTKEMAGIIECAMRYYRLQADMVWSSSYVQEAEVTRKSSALGMSRIIGLFSS
ncbi:hypothetical protein PCE1_000351 [Barthelona sp. PCE]